MRSRLVTLLPALLAAACSPHPEPEFDADWRGVEAEGSEALYAEVTGDWGLGEVVGTRIVAVDWDGDGWVDLHVHRGGDARGSFVEGETRRTWLFRNDEGRGFIDVTEDSGFRATRDGEATAERMGSIVAFGDVDNDGDLDAFTGVFDPDGSRGDTSELMINNGDGTFSLGSEDLPFRDLEVPAGATFVDIDKDGALDLWLPQNSFNGVPQQDHVFLGDGEGGFRDATDGLGLETAVWNSFDELNEARAHSNAWAAAACDLNDDGWPDLLAPSYGRAPNHVWRSEFGAGFTNVSLSSGYAFDDNQDYSDNWRFDCWCQAGNVDTLCPTEPQLTRDYCAASGLGNGWVYPRDTYPYRLGGNSGAAICADVDNDGDLDVLQTTIQHKWAGMNSDPTELHLNTGSEAIAFERPGNDNVGLQRFIDPEWFSWDFGDMSGNIHDMDNDGWPDLYIGSSDYDRTRGALFVQTSPGQWQELDTGRFFEHRRSHGVAAADFDRDGDLDLVVGHSRARCNERDTVPCPEIRTIRMYRNEIGGPSLGLQLVGGEGSNAAAIGARITVSAPIDGDEAITQTREIGGGYGHYGAQDPLEAHFGMGGARTAQVTVRWPDEDSTIQTATLPVGHRFRWVQGEQPVALGGDEE